MAMRMSGLISGMDTESVIQELVQVRKTKVEAQVKAKTKLEWKQDAWKSLNTKIRAFQSKYVNTMRFSDAFSKKTTAVSNSSVASVITGENAVDSVQNLRVEELAKTGYLTGSNIKELNGKSENYTALSKLSDVVASDVDLSEDHTITLTIGKGASATSADITVNSETSISDILTQLKNQGLNANFDESNQRFFISSKTSGEDADFALAGTDDESNAVLAGLGLTKESGATKVEGKNAVIYLNDARFESKDNVFAINGLTITVNSKTADGETVTLTTSQDTSGIYDMIRNFITEYNTLINEMDKLYNADAKTDYEPLTDDEKADMSDKEIEKWEDTIKESILRRDDSLYSIKSALTECMMDGIEIGDGDDKKTYFLSNFGISTLGYFDSADNEKNALHIDGDDKDADTSGKTDKLKSLISNDPDLVVSFFSKLSQTLYTEMDKLSSSVEGTRSFGKFYNDKLFTSQLNDYTSKISDLEDQLADYEDNWYQKFARMETALSKLQSSTNSLTSMLG